MFPACPAALIARLSDPTNFPRSAREDDAEMATENAVSALGKVLEGAQRRAGAARRRPGLGRLGRAACRWSRTRSRRAPCTRSSCA